MRKVLITILITAVLLAALLPASSFAATTQDVTITAVPSYITISNAPSTWTLNGLTGSGIIAVDTVYYSNPLGDTTPPSATVVDGECRFTVDSTGSSVAIDLSVDCGDFTTSLMDNSDTGANSATEYGGYSWYSGQTYASKIVMKTTASDVLINALAVDSTKKWGAEVETRTNAWTAGDSETATMTISAVAD